MEPAAHAAVAAGQRPFEGRADARPLAIALMGPTASGKTDLALEWAQRWPLELISVDSALVYRGMDIGSAKPDRDTLARVPHRLVDIRDPHQGWSAGEFARAARLAMDEIVAAGRVPLLVGGTGLYFRALLDGFSSLPQADAAMRARIEHEGSERGWAALHAELAAVDAAAAARIAPADRQRIGRALEVFRLSGQPISTLQAGVRSPFPYRVLRLAVAPAQRSVLHLRIVRRFDAMLGAGLLEEVRRLRQDPRLHPGLPSMRAVGYRQAWRHLDGATDAAQFRDEAIAATRQLAKRQLTWLRRELGAYWVDPAAAPGAAARAVAGFLGASSNRRGY